MIRKTVVNGTTYSISQSDVLGTGGEATVVKVGTWAVKLYHAAQLTSQRVQKLQDFMKLGINWPSRVCYPRHLAFNSAGNKIVGFAMMPMPSASEVVQKLSTKKFRRAHKSINSAYIMDLFIDGHKTVTKLHKAGIVIGDFNDLNGMFAAKRMGFIDVDSFQFGPHPCMVGTENFLDPQLYNVQLGNKPYFKPEHDWYAFVVMMIRSLILTHPYGGFHPGYKTLPQRALARVPVFDQGVKYPKPALSFDLLNDDLKSLLHTIFKNGERPTIDIAMLEEYRDGLVTCSSCGTQHPSERRSCPQCATINTQQIHRKTKIVATPGQKKVECEEMLTTTGEFIWHCLHNKTIFAVAREGSKYVLHKRHLSRIPEQMDLFSAKSDLVRFQMFGGRYLVVNQDPTQDEVLIFDVLGSTPKGIAKRVASMCHGERMFVGSHEHLWRVQGGYLFRGNMDLIGGYVENQVCGVMENQTWIDGNPVGNAIFGYQRFFHNLQYFLYKLNGTVMVQLEVKIPDFDPQESIIDTAVVWAVSSLLFLVKTEIKGKTYTRVYVIHQDDGRILSHYRVEALSSDTHNVIHGKAFIKPSGTHGVILHPTDDGVVQEIVGKNKIEKQTLLTETEPFLAESDALIQYQKGILVVHDSLIEHITMT